MENKNQIIEDAIKAFTQNRTEEQLADTLSVFRQNLDKELIVSVTQEGEGLTLKSVRTSNGKQWFTVFTSLDEQLKGKGQVQSMFSASLEKIFRVTLESDNIDGVIINPYGGSISLERPILQVVLGKKR